MPLSRRYNARWNKSAGAKKISAGAAKAAWARARTYLAAAGRVSGFFALGLAASMALR